jgi:hypothetical protein
MIARMGVLIGMLLGLTGCASLMAEGIARTVNDPGPTVTHRDGSAWSPGRRPGTAVSTDRGGSSGAAGETSPPPAAATDQQRELITAAKAHYCRQLHPADDDAYHACLAE